MRNFPLFYCHNRSCPTNITIKKTDWLMQCVGSTDMIAQTAQTWILMFYSDLSKRHLKHLKCQTLEKLEVCLISLALYVVFSLLWVFQCFHWAWQENQAHVMFFKYSHFVVVCFMCVCVVFCLYCLIVVNANERRASHQIPPTLIVAIKGMLYTHLKDY